MLTNYITEVQNLLNDSQGQFFSVPTITNYINRARRRIAYMSGCLRVVPPGTQTVMNQEVYRFSDWIPLLQAVMPGVQSAIFCRSLSVAIGPGSWKPMWKRLPWTDFQSRFRIYNQTFVGAYSEPGWWAQFGLGPNAVIYLAPIPSLAMPMEVDLTCIPQPLLNDQDLDPIPYPWQDAVAYWAATMCLLQQQRPQDAQAMAQLFANDLPMCASVVNPQMVVNPYGATLRSA